MYGVSVAESAGPALYRTGVFAVLSQKGYGTEGTQPFRFSDSRKHDMITEKQKKLPANRDRALGYKMKQPQIINTLFTPKTKRRKRVSSDPNYTSDHDNS